MAKDWKSEERAVAKALGTWWGCVFRRTPSSGAWGKQGQSRFAPKAKDAAGDFHGDIIAPPDAKFPFSVECKVYKEVELYKALYAHSNVFDWWVQCSEDTPEGMWPLLVMRENRKKPLAVLSQACVAQLKTMGVNLQPQLLIRATWGEHRFRLVVCSLDVLVSQSKRKVMGALNV